MLSGLRTLVTMAVLAAIIVVAAVWGWHAATKPFPSRQKAAVCSETQVNPGDTISPVDVTVSVLNASSREGLAERTMTDLVKHHFGAGDTGNTKDATVRTAEIWTTDPSNPAVRLVASWLPHAKIVTKAPGHAGVTVVVGEEFTKVSGGRRSQKVGAAATICSPVID